MTWTLLYAPEVIQYLYSLRERGTALRAVIRLLSIAIPDDARQLREEPETWEWLEARHWITFIVDRDIKRIHITDVESATVE